MIGAMSDKGPMRSTRSRLSAILAGCVLFGFMATASGADEKADADFFETKIRPVLIKHCYECHSTATSTSEGSLRLDSREAVRSGGDRGPAVVPGDPAASWLLTAVTHSDPDLQMPPRKAKLPNDVIADLKTWIERGAIDPRDHAVPTTSGSSNLKKAGRDFWSYQTPRPVQPPEVQDSSWPANEVDRFVLSRLEQEQLAPSADAAADVLLRRLFFVLVGLPPSPQELASFDTSIQSDGLDVALEQCVDALLQSPQFGERWGRHWLDVARFAESSGKEANISFPYAFRYRDYVIDCFQQDLPFDRFLTEQIAGDLLPYENDAERARLLTATGFLAVGTKNLDAVDAAQFAADIIDEQIDSVTRALLGSSVACARCHDHKFDPFTMQDYYALAGIFVSTKTYFGTAVSPANRQSGDPLVLPRVKGQQIFHKSIPAAKVQTLSEQLKSLRAEQEAGMAAVYKAIAEGKDASGIFEIRDALRIFWQSGGIEGELEKVDELGNALPLAMGTLEAEAAIDAPLLARGDVAQPQQTVPRGFPEAIQLNSTPSITEGESGRLQLARWLTDPQHPLTSRVLVNRLWHHVFGAGLVSSVDNFGMMGDPPSHPELLDYLAVRFVSEGWSVRRLVRELVLSRTFRQASDYNETAFQKDPENRWLWRSSKRRMDAESIRDAMLSAAGQLDLNRPDGSLVARLIGDRPISLIGLDKRLPSDLDGATHRSVYLPVIRDRLPEVLDLFDFAEPGLVTGNRETTNVPVQALYLMNSPFVRARAEGMADRLLQLTTDPSEQINQAFVLCFSRRPDHQEQQRSLDFLQSDEITKSESKPAGEESANDTESASGNADAREVLISFCQALMATAEFRNLD